MAFKDHFSGHAAIYAGARPDYPSELFEYLASCCGSHELAWDCACGNGQATQGLTGIFRSVVASDASIEQLAQASRMPAISYVLGEAETRFLATDSVDLVCIAQALHWFQTDRFFHVAGTVLKPGGVIAAWCYGLTRINRKVDQLIDHLYETVLGPYWPEERRLVENGYGSLDFPFKELLAPRFQMEKSWSLEELLAYLNSWSALQRYIRANEKDPLAEMVDDFRGAWTGTAELPVFWPISLRIGRA